MRRVLLFLAALLWGLPAALADSPPHRRAAWSGVPPWVTRAASIGIPASVDLDFADGWYFDSAGLNTLGRIAVTRASAEEESGPDGTYFPFNSGQLAVTASGAWIWEARTQKNRNSVAGGATGGGAPTNWSFAALNGVTLTSGATFTNKGLTFLPIVLSGTANASSTVCPLLFETTTSIPATFGQTWSESVSVYTSGTVPALLTDIAEYSSTPTLVNDNRTAFSPTSSPARYQASATLSNTATASVVDEICFTTVNSTAYSGTINVAVPQIEQDALINSTLASASVASGGTACVPGTDTFTIVGGTGTPATVSGTVTGGILGGPLTVTPGSYSVFPPSPASTTGGTCTTQPTINLVPTNNATAGFATSPILTTSAAATRAATMATLALPAGATSTSGYSLLGIGTPMAPTGFSTNQEMGQIDDGSSNNRLFVYRNLINGDFISETEIAGVTTLVTITPVWAQGALGKLTAFASPNSIKGVANNGTIGSGTPVGLAGGLITIRIGSNTGGASQFNGPIARLVECACNLLGN